MKEIIGTILSWTGIILFAVGAFVIHVLKSELSNGRTPESEPEYMQQFEKLFEDKTGRMVILLTFIAAVIGILGFYLEYSN